MTDLDVRPSPPAPTDILLRRVPLRPADTAGRTVTVQLGRIPARQACSYLAVWAALQFLVLTFTLSLGYALLYLLGVIRSVSHSLAIVLAEPLPASGLLPALQPGAAVLGIMVVSLALAVLWWLSTCALVLVHNAVSSLTDGPAVEVRVPDRQP